MKRLALLLGLLLIGGCTTPVKFNPKPDAIYLQFGSDIENPGNVHYGVMLQWNL